MVGRVSVKVIAICMVSAVIIVGVVPDSKGSALVSWWYRTGIFKAIPKWFLYFFEAEEILGLTIAPWLSSSLGLLNLMKSSWAVLINVYFSSGVNNNNNNNNNNNFIYIALKSNNCPKRYLITK